MDDSQFYDTLAWLFIWIFYIIGSCGTYIMFYDPEHLRILYIPYVTILISGIFLTISSFFSHLEEGLLSEIPLIFIIIIKGIYNAISYYRTKNNTDSYYIQMPSIESLYPSVYN